MEKNILLFILQQQSALTDLVLMDLSENVDIQDMKVLALGEFGLDAPKVNNLAHAHEKNPELFNFDILSQWRNKTAGSTKWVRHLI